MWSDQLHAAMGGSGLSRLEGQSSGPAMKVLMVAALLWSATWMQCGSGRLSVVPPAVKLGTRGTGAVGWDQPQGTSNQQQ